MQTTIIFKKAVLTAFFDYCLVALVISEILTQVQSPPLSY